MSQSTPDADSHALLLTLTSQREHVLGILEGLDEEALRRPVLPSRWTCVGLVHHLALDVERFWFRGTVAGEQAVIDAVNESSDDGWHVGPDQSALEVFDLYRREIDRANEILATTPLDAAPTWWPEFFGDYRLGSVREIILHVLVETACHAGHLDAVRELIDGRRWMVLD